MKNIISDVLNKHIHLETPNFLVALYSATELAEEEMMGFKSNYTFVEIDAFREVYGM